MPKIRIREKDYTANELDRENENIVFLVDDKADATPKLLVYGDDTSAYTNKDTIDRILALGGKVIVCKTYGDAKAFLKDRNQFDVKFLMVDEEQPDPEIEVQEQHPNLRIALEIAKHRRDCVVIYGKTSEEYDKEETKLLNQGLGGDGFLSEETGFAGKYCLPFFGKALVEGKEAFSAGLAYILAFLKAKNDGNAEWLAVAGAKRGGIPADLDVGFLTEDQIDAMQPSTGDGVIAINPIVKMNPWGVRIWGNRSALPMEGRKGLKASHFANIRILTCDLKKQLYKAAREYQFEQNNDVLWFNFKARVNNLLDDMVQSYGIAGYKWIKEETNERAKLKATLKIVPIEPVEDFDLTIDLVDSLEVIE